MSEKVVVISIYPDGDAREWMDKAMDVIEDLCQCRRHWWQFWRPKECSFYGIAARVEDVPEYDDD